MNLPTLFDKFSRKATKVTGSHWAFICAFGFILGWVCAGPYYHWSESHSLFVNTATTIVTFLMVFVIQQSSNKDTKAIHLKLDEIIRVTRDARNEVSGIEERTDDEIEKLKKAI